MDDKEKLKLTDFLDPIIQLAIGLAVAGDILFFILPLRYIFAVIIGIVLWPGMKGFTTKFIFIICLVLPLPLMTIGTVLGIILSNGVVRMIATQVAIQALSVATVGGAEVLEVGAVAETAAAGAEVVASTAAAAAEAGAGIAAAGAEAGAIGAEAAAAGAEAVGATAEAGAGFAGEAAGAVPKPIGPSAQPPEMPGPQAQPEEAGKPSLKERAKKKIVEKAKEKLAEKLAEEEEPQDEQKQNQEEEPNIIEGEFGNPDLGNFTNNEEEGDDGGTVDLRKAA